MAGKVKTQGNAKITRNPRDGHRHDYNLKRFAGDILGEGFGLEMFGCDGEGTRCPKPIVIRQTGGRRAK